MKNKMSKLIKILFIILCMSISMVFVCSCNDDSKVQVITFPEISFSSSSNADIDTYYKLEMALPDGVSVEKITLRSITNEVISLDNNNGFTPTTYGAYIYTLELLYKQTYKEIKYQVNVADKDIPEIVSKPNDITIESGIYNDFEEDLSLVGVSCKNTSLLDYIDIKVVKIEGNNIVAQSEDGFDSFLFNRTGDYTITISATTPMGKQATTSYKITVKDSVAPVISIDDNVFTWINGGEVVIPTPRIYDDSSFQKTVVVKKNNIVQSCEDNSVTANVSDVFDVTYTVTDEYQNQSTKTIKLYAMAKGTLVNNNAAFASVIKGENGVCEYLDGLLLQSNLSNDTFKFNTSAFAYDITSNYKNICFDIDNLQSLTVNVKAYAFYGTKKVCVGSFDVNAGNSKQYVPVETTVGLTGISFETTSNKRICLKLNEVSLNNTTIPVAVNDQLSEGAVKTIDFSDDSYYDLKTIVKDGFEKKSSNKFGTVKGLLYSSVDELSTNGGLFSTAVAVNNVNYIELHVYAERSAKILFNVVVNTNKIVSIEGNLSKGVNTVKKYVTDLEIVSVDGLTIVNNNEFTNNVYIECLNLYTKTAITDSEVFTSNVDNIIVKYNEQFYIPEVVKSSAGAIKSASTKLTKDGETVAPSLAIGEALNIYLFDNPVGVYKLVYTCEDIFGKEHTKQITVTALDKEFCVSVNIAEDYFAGNVINLPDAVIEGEVYENNKSNIVVNKYYKVEGGLSWINANDGFVVESSAYIDVKYTVSVPNVVSEVVEKSLYIHGKGLTFDYEIMSDGTHLGNDQDYDKRVPGYVTSNWSHDGKYSYLMKGALYYNACTGVTFTQAVELGKQCDSVIFYAYAEKDISALVKVEVYCQDIGWIGATVQILKGEHQYILKFPREFSKFTKFTSTTIRNEDFYIDSVAFDKLADISLAEKQDYYVAGEQFELGKPTFESFSQMAFSEKQINNAEVSVTIKNKADNSFTTYTYNSKAISLSLEKGEYSLTYNIVVGDITFELTDSIEVTNLPIKFNQPVMSYNANEATNLVTPTLYGGIEAITSIYYKEAGSDEWTVIDGTSITLPKVGEYQLKYVVTANNKVDEKIYNIIVHDGYTLADFEIDVNGNHYGYIDSLYEKVAWDGSISSEWSADGLYSLKVKPYTISWSGFKYTGTGKSVVLPEPCGFVELWVKASVAMPGWVVEFKGGSVIATGTTNVMAGAHKYVIKLSKKIQTIDTYAIFFMPSGCGVYYLDSIKFLNIDVEFPEVDSVVKRNEEISLGSVEDVDSLTVKYKYEEDEEYTVIEKVGNNYPITFTKCGKVTIVYEAMKQDFLFNEEYSVEVQAFVTTWTNLQTGITINKELTIAPPTSDSDIAVNIYYKQIDATEWTEIVKTGDSFKTTFTTAGEYQIKEVASLGEESVEKIYPLCVRNAEVIFDFETDENGNHYGVAGKINYDGLANPCYSHTITDEWSANGTYSVYIKPLNVSWAGYDYSASPIILSKATNTFEITINSNIDYTGWQFEIHDGKGWRTVTLDLQKGEHTYQLVFNTEISKINKIDFYINCITMTSGFYLDNFCAVYDD